MVMPREGFLARQIRQARNSLCAVCGGTGLRPHIPLDDVNDVFDVAVLAAQEAGFRAGYVRGCRLRDPEDVDIAWNIHRSRIVQKKT